MILAVDVQYSGDEAVAAGVLFTGWQDEAPRLELISRIKVPAPYEPGQFYRRELPCILQLIDENRLQPDCIVIDGYVWLGGCSIPGLGWYLHEALGGRVVVIGVAKSRFRGIGSEYAVYRGRSGRPLYVTVAGMDQDTAKEAIRSMHGKFRLPTLLKRVDLLSREEAPTIG